jgi:hypothetical protein
VLLLLFSSILFSPFVAVLAPALCAVVRTFPQQLVSEGFDTTELKEAKALVEELS